MNAGITDPMAFLALGGADWDIACAIVRKAREMKADARKDELKNIVNAIGQSVGNQVAQAIQRMF